MASASLFMVEKKKNFEKELLLFWTVLVTLISMPVNQNEGQWLKPRKNFLLTNDTLSQYELVCLRVDLIESWSPTIKAVRLRIKMYRLLLISLYYSKRMYQSQNRSKSFRRFGTQLVLSLWPLCRCAPKKKKKTHLNPTNTFRKYFQTAAALKHRNAKPKRISIRISTLHFKILEKRQTWIQVRC